MKKKLFTPGPVGVSEDVLKKLSAPVIFHRSKDFEKLYKRMTGNLNKIFGADSSYTTLVLTGSGTMANEVVLASLRIKKLLIISNGHFGERLGEIAKANKIRFELLNIGWAQPFNLELIENKMKEYEPDLVAAVLLETSTGMVNAIRELGNICKSHRVTFFVDAVSGLGAEKISVIKDSIDICTSVPNKALEAPPGLSFICIKKSIVSNPSWLQNKSFYLNIGRYYQKSLIFQTPTTPAVSLYAGLDRAIKAFLNETLKERRVRYGKLSQMVVHCCNELNLKFLIETPKHRAIAITTLILDTAELAEQLKLYLYQKSFIVWHNNYNHKDERFNRLIQISVMGNIAKRDVRQLFSHIQIFLQRKYGKK